MTAPQSLRDLLQIKAAEIQAQKNEIEAHRQEILEIEMSISEIEQKLSIDVSWFDSVSALLPDPEASDMCEKETGEVASLDDLPKPTVSIKELVCEAIVAADPNGEGLSSDQVFKFITEEMRLGVKFDSVMKAMSALKADGVLDKVGGSRPAIYRPVTASKEDLSEGGEPQGEGDQSQGQDAAAVTEPAAAELAGSEPAAPEVSEPQVDAAEVTAPTEAAPVPTESAPVPTEAAATEVAADPAMTSAPEAPQVEEVQADGEGDAPDADDLDVDAEGLLAAANELDHIASEMDDRILEQKPAA